jgi:acetyl-CoA synthetase
MRYGNEHVTKYDRSSLRILGTVGEPIDPQSWKWYYEVVGDKKCSVVDTYWQSETGGILVSSLPGATPMKPGSATLPFFGIDLRILDPFTSLPVSSDSGEKSGVLAIAKPWPGMARTVYGDHKRFLSTYFEPFKGYYFTGDGATIDSDGYVWIKGRVDDVITKAGHRLGTAEIESALLSYLHCSETAVIDIPHDIRGQSIVAYCVLNEDVEESLEHCSALKLAVRKVIGAIAVPDYVILVQALPKTRSGKIMRRILRKLAANDYDLGDLSTLADPPVVEILKVSLTKYLAH